MSKRVIEIPLSENADSSIAQDLEILKKDLKALGVDIAIPDVLSAGILTFEYDDEAHKRNAGRKKKHIPEGSELADMTQEQIDEWLLQASISDIQKTLGVGRATAYRRVREARSRIDYAVIELPESKPGDPNNVG